MGAYFPEEAPAANLPFKSPPTDTLHWQLICMRSPVGIAAINRRPFSGV